MPKPPAPVIAIIGAGPAGLRAAEVLAQAGMKARIYDRKPSPGRKFLMAGRGGLNLTHSELFESFMTRYGEAKDKLAPAIKNFPPAALREWAGGLNEETFVGSSGRVFPKSFKASPLLRAWLARLNALGVEFFMKHDWRGWDDQGLLVFKTSAGAETFRPDACILALGGASWPNLGSDGSWTKTLEEKNIPVIPLKPANCGFAVAWSDMFRERFAGAPIKSIKLTFEKQTVPSELMIGRNGIEGGAVYALSAAIRDAVLKKGEAAVSLDLHPNLSENAIVKKLEATRGRQSFSTYLQKNLNLPPVVISLLREIDRDAQNKTPANFAAFIKNFPLRLGQPFPIARAISTAGGVGLDALDENFMLKKMPGVFVAGEMLDWEAPTGGYLLQACFATGQAAATGVLKLLAKR